MSEPGTEPSDVSETPRTGNGAVDAALARLEDVDSRTPADQIEVYDDVHRQLQDALAEATPANDRR
ncbi:MAG: hypothetical protein ACTHMZ_12470 [Actinomycetes bacterium]